MAKSDPREVITDTIASSADGSSGVPLGGLRVVAIEFETGANTFDTSTAWVLFKASQDGSTYQWVMAADGTIYGVEVVATTNTTGWAYVNPDAFRGARFLSWHTCSNQTGTGVTQTAERTIKYICE